MKGIVRFAVCLAVLLLAVHECAVVVPWVHARLRSVPAESCGTFAQQKLTAAQAWPVIPSLRQWERALLPEGGTFAVFFERGWRELPMCRYEGERGCWIPMTIEQHACTPAELAVWRKREAQTPEK